MTAKNEFELGALRKKIEAIKAKLLPEEYQDLVSEIRIWEEFLSRSETSIESLSLVNGVLKTLISETKAWEKFLTRSESNVDALSAATDAIKNSLEKLEK